MRWTSQAGQAATETMMVISVVTVAVVAAGYSFVPVFGRGVDGLAKDVQAILETGDIGGNGGGSGGSGGSSGSGGSGGSGGPSTAGNNTGDVRNGSLPSAFATSDTGNDTGSIPNQGPGSPDPRYVPDMPQFSAAPGNDTDPVFNDPDGGGAFPANRGSLGAAGPIAGNMGSDRGFGGPG